MGQRPFSLFLPAKSIGLGYYGGAARFLTSGNRTFLTLFYNFLGSLFLILASLSDLRGVWGVGGPIVAVTGPYGGNMHYPIM